jgi:hypothetical protein
MTVLNSIVVDLRSAGIKNIVNDFGGHVAKQLDDVNSTSIDVNVQM